MNPDYNCYSLRMAGFLMMNGFVLRHLKSDTKSRRKVFIFNDSKELQEKIMNYMAGKLITE